MNKYKLSFIIGRFQPFHYSHLDLLKEALSVADKTVICIGSTECSRTTKNPLTFEERVQLFHFEDFRTMLESAGFQIETVFGSYSLDSLTDDSPRLIIVAKKKRNAPIVD